MSEGGDIGKIPPNRADRRRMVVFITIQCPKCKAKHEVWDNPDNRERGRLRWWSLLVADLACGKCGTVMHKAVAESMGLKTSEVKDAKRIA
jgi:hypothetical protein